MNTYKTLLTSTYRSQMVSGTIRLSTGAGSQETVMGSVQRVVAASTQVPCGAAVQHCLQCLGS